MVLQLLFIPPLLGATLVLLRGHHLWPRFFFFSFAFAVFVVVRGTVMVGERVARSLGIRSVGPTWVGTGLCILLILASAASVPFVFGPKQDYLGALKFVEAQREPADAVVTVGLASFPYKSLYQPAWEAVEHLETLNSIRARARRTWLLYTLPPVLEALYPSIMRSVQHDFRLVKEFHGTLQGGTVFVCRADSPPASQ